MTMTDASSKYFDQVAGQWDNIRAGLQSATTLLQLPAAPVATATGGAAGTGSTADGQEAPREDGGKEGVH